MRKGIDWETMLRVMRDISRGTGNPVICAVTRREDLPTDVERMVCTVDAEGKKPVVKIDWWDREGHARPPILFPRKPDASR